MAKLLFDDSLTVQTQSHDYPIIITASRGNSEYAAGAKAEISSMAERVTPYITGQQVLIVTNDTVAPLYLQPLQQQLSTDFQVAVCVLPDGEQYKNQDHINQIYDALMAQHFNRDVTLIALGGGVIGDMTGFAAASFMRGVN